METDKFVKSLLTLRENFQQYAKMYDSSIELLLQAATMKDKENLPNDVIEEQNDNAINLLKYVPDYNKCLVIEKMFLRCRSNDDLKSALLSINESKLIKWREMDKQSFRNLIIPMLGYETTETALKAFMYRINP